MDLRDPHTLNLFEVITTNPKISIASKSPMVNCKEPTGYPRFTKSMVRILRGIEKMKFARSP